MISTSKKKVKLGDVFQIPLPDGRFGYGRVYKDTSVGVYRQISDKPLEPPIGSRDFLFIVGLYTDVLQKGLWQIIDHDGFENEDLSWPPPSFVKDIITGDYQIYYKGELRPAEEWEVKGLEEAAVWDSSQIIERIMKESAGA